MTGSEISGTRSVFLPRVRLAAAAARSSLEQVRPARMSEARCGLTCARAQAHPAIHLDRASSAEVENRTIVGNNVTREFA